MDNLKTATKFFLEKYISGSRFTTNKISPKIPQKSLRIALVYAHILPPPSQSKHGFVPQSLARFQAANKQRNNSARRGG